MPMTLLADFLRSGLNPGELVLVVVPGQGDPAGEITAGAGVGGQQVGSQRERPLVGQQPVLRQEGIGVGMLEFQHGDTSY